MFGNENQISESSATDELNNGLPSGSPPGNESTPRQSVTAQTEDGASGAGWLWLPFMLLLSVECSVRAFGGGPLWLDLSFLLPVLAGWLPAELGCAFSVLWPFAGCSHYSR